MARTRIREGNVLDSDFESEAEALARLQAHVLAFAHPPLAQTGVDDNYYLKFDGTNYVWSAVAVGASIIPTPDPIADDQKILRYDGNTDLVEWVEQADIATIALPYYFDAVRNKYLGNTLQRVMFYKNGANKRNTYMYYAPSIASNKFPHEVRAGEDLCLVSYEYSTTDKNKNRVIDILDANNSYSELAYLDLGGTKINYLYDDTANLDFLGGQGICARILGTTLSNSVLVLGFRKIYTPQ